MHKFDNYYIATCPFIKQSMLNHPNKISLYMHELNWLENKVRVLLEVFGSGNEDKRIKPRVYTGSGTRYPTWSSLEQISYIVC